MCEICRMLYDMMEKDGSSGFFDDDGNRYDPKDIRKPQLCRSCRKDGDHSEYICCMLNRLDFMLDPPPDNTFVCGAFAPALPDVQSRN